jgi:hypothetical protein
VVRGWRLVVINSVNPDSDKDPDREIAFKNNKAKNLLENGDNQLPGLLACPLLPQAFDLY